MSDPKFDAAGAGLWSSITGTYELRADELRVLEDACREADLIEVLQAAMAGADLIVKGSMGQPVINPIVSELRQHRNTLRGLLAALRLPDDSGGEVNQQRAAGNASWAKRGA